MIDGLIVDGWKDRFLQFDRYRLQRYIKVLFLRGCMWLGHYRGVVGSVGLVYRHADRWTIAMLDHLVGHLT